MALPMNTAAEVVHNVASIQEQNKKGARNQRPDLSQIVDGNEDGKRAGEGVRTLDFDLGKVALYH